MTFASAVFAEFNRRRSVNSRYSLRAFAAALGVSHSALSRVGRGGQRASDATIASIGRRLQWPAARITSLIREERINRLQDAAESEAFVADARWIASRTNLPLDGVQLALHEAIRTGRLEMRTAERWKVNR